MVVLKIMPHHSSVNHLDALVLTPHTYSHSPDYTCFVHIWANWIKEFAFGLGTACGST